jgi:hypothetical protein
MLNVEYRSLKLHYSVLGVGVFSGRYGWWKRAGCTLILREALGAGPVCAAIPNAGTVWAYSNKICSIKDEDVPNRQP